MIKKILNWIKELFTPESITSQSDRMIHNMFPVNTFNSTDEECIKSDFEKIISDKTDS